MWKVDQKIIEIRYKKIEKFKKIHNLKFLL